ncbi:unnamed protein product [Lota lota]
MSRCETSEGIGHEKESLSLRLPRGPCLCSPLLDGLYQCAYLFLSSGTLHSAPLTAEEPLHMCANCFCFPTASHEGVLQHLEEQAEDSTTKAFELESSLAECREELTSCLQQMEEVRENFKKDLQ